MSTKLYDEDDLEAAHAEGVSEGRRLAADSNGADYQRGVSDERARIAALAGSPEAHANPAAVLAALANGAASIDPENITAIVQAHQIASDASWQEVAAKLNAEGGHAPTG